MNIFFTSDQHFNHKNIMKYCNRPFKTVEEMNETIIEKYNSLVKNNDLVYILGDICLGSPLWYLTRLNGKKILVKGNHDKKINIHVQEKFNMIYDLVTIKIEKQHIVLCHYPLRSWNLSCHGSWHLHGHCHGQLVHTGDKSLDVGVDNWDFFPISYDKVKEEINNISEKLNFLNYN